MLDVAEIFTSLQGEGPLAGQPALFIRLAGCLPPFCPWCDTPHALDPDGPATVTMSVDDLLRHADMHPRLLIVITGGEPFRQWTQGLEELANQLTARGRRVQYETSGKAGIPSESHGMVVCSPKPLEAPTLDPALIPRVHAFKFVVGNDLAPVLRFVQAADLDPAKIWLMPLGRTRSEQLAAMPQVWEHCLRHGFRFSPRLHVLAFNDRKGI